MKTEAKLGLYLQIQVLDKNGKIKHDTGRVQAKCFVSNFVTIWSTILLDGTRYPYLYRTTGDASALTAMANWDSNSYMWSMINPDSDLCGIVVGTDDTMPVDYRNINMGNKINDGTNIGELTYGTMDTSDTVKVLSGGVEWTVFREFTNSSGGIITVKEIGIISRTDASQYSLMARDILPASVAVADSDVMRVGYTFRTEEGYTLQFLQILAEIWTWRSKAALIKQIDGGTVAIASTALWDSAYAPMAARYGMTVYDSNLDGLIVGTGDTPTTLTDYTLETPIASGDGAGQLVYGLTQIFATQTVQGEDQFKPDANGDMPLIISRTFHNKSLSLIHI